MAKGPPRSEDLTEESTQHHRVWWLAGAGLSVLVVLLVACVFWIPGWLYPSLTQADVQIVPDAAKVLELKDARLKLQNDARATLLQGVGALLVLVGAAAGAYAAFQQVQATQDQIAETAKASYNQLKLSEEGQITDRFTNAINQLDDKMALAVRLGGLYALERIARDSPADRSTIAEIPCAYARTAPRPKPPPLTPLLPSREAWVNRPIGSVPSFDPPPPEPVRLTVRAPDVQAAVTILGRWRERLGEPPSVLDLHDADLQGADLYGAQLQGAWLSDTQLQNADLDEAQLQNAFLVGAEFRRASLHGTQLQGTSLDPAQLEGTMASETTGWPDGWNEDRAREAGVWFDQL